jgi:hypothetical protein
MTDATASAFFFSAVASLGVWLVVAGTAKGWLREALFLATLPMIITLDLAHTNIQVYRTAPAEAAWFEPAFVQVLRAREGALMPGRFRLLTILGSKSVVPKRVFRLLGYESDQVMGRQALYPEHNAEFHLEAADGHLPGYSAALTAMLPKKMRVEAAGRFNVTYYVGRRSYLPSPQFANSLVAVVPEYDLALYQNPAPAKPRAYLSLKPERVDSPVDPAALAARSDFLNGEVDVIEAPAVTLPGPVRTGKAVIERYAPEEVRVRVETPQPAVLILLDAFDQGWTATLESGLELPIMRANALVRAVVVPTGVHTITFRYETPLLRAGAAVSLTGMLLCLGLIVRASWRRRSNLGAP